MATNDATTEKPKGPPPFKGNSFMSPEEAAAWKQATAQVNKANDPASIAPPRIDDLLAPGKPVKAKEAAIV